MTLVRNNKPSRVGLPTESGATVYFDPGTHEYPDEDLEGILTQRAAVRAYLEPQGDKPAVIEVIEVVRDGEGTPSPTPDPTPDNKKPAAELKKLILESSDPDWLRSVIAGDDRTTVVAAADLRLVEVLVDAQDDPPPDDQSVASSE